MGLSLIIGFMETLLKFEALREGLSTLFTPSLFLDPLPQHPQKHAN